MPLGISNLGGGAVRRGGFASLYLSSKIWVGLFPYIFSVTITMHCCGEQGREGGSVIDTRLQIRLSLSLSWHPAFAAWGGKFEERSTFGQGVSLRDKFGRFPSVCTGDLTHQL